MRTDGPVLVIGGTRGTGLLIALKLIDEGLPVRVLARNPGVARQRLGSRCEIVHGDLTDAPSLYPALANVGHVIFTAGCRSGRPVGSARIRRTEYLGVVNTLAAADATHFGGRLLYMTSSGIGQRSFWTFGLNLYKGNTLHWRQRAETAIRASGVAYTILRTGMLMNARPRPEASW
jgi:NADH dehydrogenase